MHHILVDNQREAVAGPEAMKKVAEASINTYLIILLAISADMVFL